MFGSVVQCGELLLERGDLRLSVGLLGPLVGDDLFGCRLHETLVRELLHHRSEESLVVFEVVLQLGPFGFGVDLALERYEVLRRLDQEGRGGGILLRDGLDGREVGHLADHGGELRGVVLVRDDVERERLLLRQVLLVADVADRGDDLLHQLETRQHRLVGLARLRHLRATQIEAPLPRPASACQISSVTKGMKGCRMRIRASKKPFVASERPPVDRAP